MNSVNVIGNLVGDPELRELPSGKSVCDFRIAINEGYGENKRVIFISVSCWQKLAEIVSQFCIKGTQVAIEGSLRQDNWEKDGEKRSAILINAREVKFLSGTKDKDGNVRGNADENGQGAEKSKKDENLPF